MENSAAFVASFSVCVCVAASTGYIRDRQWGLPAVEDSITNFEIIQ